MSDEIKQVTDDSFQQEVLESELPILVDFWAPRCPPCRIMAPILDDLAEEYGDRVTIVKVNVDENPNTPSKLGILAIPTLIMYVGGKEIERKVGFAPKPVLRRRIDSVLEDIDAG